MIVATHISTDSTFSVIVENIEGTYIVTDSNYYLKVYCYTIDEANNVARDLVNIYNENVE